MRVGESSAAGSAQIECKGAPETGHATLRTQKARIDRPIRTSAEQEKVFQLVSALKHCSEVRDLEDGTKVHRDAVVAGFEYDKYVAAGLIRMYSKCRKMALAQQVFDRIIRRDVVIWTSLILGYVENDQNATAMELFTRMDCEASKVTYIAVLKACSGSAGQKNSEKQFWLNKGIHIHKQLTERNIGCDMALTNTLLDMYCKCGSMELARQVFDRMVHRTVVTWNCLILGYVENNECSVALSVFSRMDCTPSVVTYVAVLKACSGLASSEKELSLEKGIGTHKQVKECGYDSNIILSNSLIDMYSKCGRIELAREVFDEMAHRDAVTWTCLVLGYVENSESSAALDLFFTMDCRPDSVTFAAGIKACGCLASEAKSGRELCLRKGLIIYEKVKKCGLETDVLVANALVDMFCKCGSMLLAKNVFDGMKSRTVVSWNSLMLGYVENGESSAASKLFNSIDCEPSSVTYVALLKACSCLFSETEKRDHLTKVISIHEQVRSRGFDSDVVVANTLIDVYSKCGSMEAARKVFDEMNDKTVVTWNSFILGYVENGESLVALNLFNSMDCAPDSVTYVAALKACGSLVGEDRSMKKSCLHKGTAIHREVKAKQLDSDVLMATSLLDMYRKCGDMLLAREVFETMIKRDVVTWTCIILGYVENGESLVALELFARMDCQPDSHTYIVVLKAYSNLASDKVLEKRVCLEKGIALHEKLKTCSLESDLVVANTLIDMYTKCGSMQGARDVFDKMITQDVVTWNSLILGYVEHGESLEAFDMFTRMSCAPDSLTYVAVLKACGRSGNTSAGLQTHARICKLGLESDQMVTNALMDFHGKCGKLCRAEELFYNMHSPGIVSWNTLISGYCSIGNSSQVFLLTKRMKEALVSMDSVTFVSVLTTCSHAGLLEEGKRHFQMMLECGVDFSVEHYSCMVDMFGRVGKLEEAVDVVRKMPLKADAVVWMTLLGACKKWKNLNVGKIVFDELMQVASSMNEKTAAHVLMRDIYGCSSTS